MVKMVPCGLVATSGKLNALGRPIMCKFTFSNKDFLMQHHLKMHDHWPYKCVKGTYECSICGQVFTTVYTKHQHEERGNCDQDCEPKDCCGKTWIGVMYTRHVKEVHDGNVRENCKVCGRSIKAYPVGNMKYHLERHNGK